MKTSHSHHLYYRCEYCGKVGVRDTAEGLKPCRYCKTRPSQDLTTIDGLLKALVTANQSIYPRVSSDLLCATIDLIADLRRRLEAEEEAK